MSGAAQQQRAPLDLVAVGTTFLDLVFAGVGSAPPPGTEVFADALGLSLGGAVTVAAQAARLGAECALLTQVGGDPAAGLVRRMLGELGLRQEWVTQLDVWRQPVTVSMATADDRALLSYYEPLPLGASPAPELPSARITFEYIGHEGAGPLSSATRPSGSVVIYDTGWDPSQTWDPDLLRHLAAADVFTPNAVEAMGFTRTDTPLAAAKALAERVPLVVVKCGSEGAIAVDATTNTVFTAPAPPVRAVDPTGAGDIFAGAFIGALIRGLDPSDCLDLATLAASISVTRLGGAAAAVSWSDLRTAATAYGPDLARRYAFLADLEDIDPHPSSLRSSKESTHVV